MYKCNVMAGVKVETKLGIQNKKLWVEEELTERFRQTGYSPDVGYILSTGDKVIDKGSDHSSIILFINQKQEKNESPVRETV